MKILMVCLGNICRSPVAEGIMKAKAAKYHLDLAIDSAGTSGWHDGSQPDPRSIQNAAKNKVDISKQKSRRVHLSDFELFDVIYAMDKENYNNLINLAPHGLHHKVKMILNESHPGENKSVPDPYYTEDGFDEVYTLVDEACERIALNIKNNG
jgi:protein-tyrosine phosphatase